MAEKTIETVLHEHSGELMAISGVVGTAIGQCSGKPCIKVFVQEKKPAYKTSIPASLEGYPVSIEVIGEIKAL